MENVRYVKRRYREVLRKTKIKTTRDESIECCSIFKDQGFLKRVSVTNAEGPPVPIPNTEVKLCSGENTLREAVREDSPMLTYVRGTRKTVSLA